MSLAGFLPACWGAIMALAALSMSSRSGAGSLLVAIAALALPAACVLGPAFAWNFDDRYNSRAAQLARCSPLMMAGVLALLILLPL